MEVQEKLSFTSNKQKIFFQYLKLPGVISMFSLFAGWIAIGLLLKNLPFLGITSAVIAFYLDCLDGYIARRTRTESEFGRQLDSMFDFFNYTVFSALLFWLYILPSVTGFFISFVILATGAFRLVRFNIEGFVVKDGVHYYAGVVVCHISLTAILLFMLQQYYPQLISFTAAPIMLIISLLQISGILIRKTNSYTFWLMVALSLFILSLAFHLWQK